MTFRWSLTTTCRDAASFQPDPPHADAAIETDSLAVRPATTPDRNLSLAPYCSYSKSFILGDGPIYHSIDHCEYRVGQKSDATNSCP